MIKGKWSIHLHLVRVLNELSRDPLKHLSVATKRKSVVALPDVTTARTSLVVTVTLAPETTVLLTSRGKTTDLTVLHDRTADPVDLRVTTDSGVRGVDHDNLKELEGTILSNGIRVEDAEVHATSTSAHLSDGAEVVGAGHAQDPLIAGLAPDDSTVCRTTAATTTDADTINDIALLGLVAEHTSLVGAGGASSAVHDRQVAELPAAHTSKEAHHIALLLLPKLTDETVCTHLLQSHKHKK